MVTPASSTTSPSPPPGPSAFLLARPPSIGYNLATTSTTVSPSIDDVSDHPGERKQAVDRFLARAELANLTRGLRTRLAYASYKATNSLQNASLPELEAKSALYQQALAQSKVPSVPSKRKAGSAFVHYDAPGQTRGSSSHAVQTSRAPTATGSMGPPARPLVFENVTFAPAAHVNPTPPLPAAMLRSYYPDGMDATGQPTGQKGSLYAEMLAPPAKQARTIHNPGSPLISAPDRQQPRPVVRRSSRHSVDESSRTTRGASSSRPRAHSHTTASGRSADSRDKGKGRERSETRSRGAPPGEDDVKAAATLTSLLMQSAARSGLPASPRSVTSDLRTTPSMATAQLPPSNSPRFANAVMRTSTPPVINIAPGVGATTPKRTTSTRSDTSTTSQGPGAPTDSEAADLMLFLATSPSPSTRERARRGSESDFGIRSISSDGLRAKGRVLFGGAEGNASAQPQARTLNRTATAPTQWESARSVPPARSGSYTGGTPGGLGLHTITLARSPLVSEIVPTPVEENGPGLPALALSGQSSRHATGLLLTALPDSRPPPPPSLATTSVGPNASSSSSIGSVASSSPGPNLLPTSALGFSLGDFMHIAPTAGSAAAGVRISKEEGALHGRRLFEAV